MTYIPILYFYISFLLSNHSFVSSHTYTTALGENKVLCPLPYVSTKTNYEKVLAVATTPSKWKG